MQKKKELTGMKKEQLKKDKQKLKNKERNTKIGR